jgi:hypothetical protein
MDNITMHVDPTTLGPWDVEFFERTTRAPFSPAYPFIFDYGPPTFAVPFGLSPGHLFGFPAAWSAITPASFLDTFLVRVESPLFPDTRLVTFELRVDGVLVDTIEVTLTNELSNEANGTPEPSTFALSLLGLFALGYRRRRRNRPA